MSTFSQQNRKLQKIFNDIKSNKSALDNRKNEQILLNFFKSTNKAHISISDTDWIAKAPDDNDLKTINKGALLPESLSVTYSDQLEIPDFLLPYIDIQMLIKTPPDSVLTSYDKYTTENYTGDHITVKGDGSNVYTGPFPLTGNNLIAEADLDIVVPSANTKKVWNVIILHTNPSSGDDWQTTGELVGIRTTENTQTCEGDPDTITIEDTFECRPFEYPTYPAYHKITNFTASGFTGVGDFTNESFTSGPPDCNTSSVTTDQTTLSKTFSAMDEYLLRVDGTHWNITQSSGFSGIGSVIGSHITDITITFQGYRPYYSSLTQKEFQAGDAGDILLQNFPDTASSETLPYTSLTLQRNLGSLANILNTDIDEDIFLISTKANLTNGNNIRKDLSLFKIQEGNSNHFPYYHMKFSIGATILSPAIVDNPDPQISTQSDIYSVSGTTYARSSNIDGLVSEAFVTEKQDIQYRIMIIVKNPFWYQEIRKYGTSE